MPPAKPVANTEYSAANPSLSITSTGSPAPAASQIAGSLANLPEAHPGCLAASFCYQDQLFNQEIRDLNAASVLRWRHEFRSRLEAIAARYPPARDTDLEALADMAASNVEGGLILGRLLKDPSILPWSFRPTG